MSENNYIIVEAYNKESLEEKVSEMLEHGYVTTGGHILLSGEGAYSYSKRQSTTILSQAMVLKSFKR